MGRATSRRNVIVGLIVLVGALSVLGYVQLRASDAQNEAAPRASVGAGIRAVVDPATGGIATDPEVIREVLAARAPAPPRSSEEALRTSDEGLFAEELPNGLTVVDLQGRFMQPLVVTVPEELAADSEATPAAAHR